MAFLVHRNKLAKLRRLTVLRQRHEIVYEREQTQQSKNTHARLHGTAFTQLQHHAEYKFCTY